MRHPIEESPRDGTAIILEDDASETYDVAHWSKETGEWVGENGEPTKIAPTHWYPIPGDQYLSREDKRSRGQSQAGRARRFAVSSIAATLFATALIVTYFHAEVASQVTRYTNQEDFFRVNAIGGYITELLANRDSRKSNLVAQGRIEAGQPSAPAEAQQAAPVQQVAMVPVAEAQQSLKEDRAEGWSLEPMEARRAIEWLDVQLQNEAAKSARSFEEEREKASALAMEAAVARKELAANAEQHRQALEEERARGAELTRELATAQRENERQGALLKASAETAQLKEAEAAKSSRSLEEAREKAAALAVEAAAARKELAANAEQHRQALEEERGRRAVLWSELATAEREIEVQAAQLRQASNETGQQAEAAQSARSLGEAREKAAALALEATAARNELAASAEQHRQALEEERARGAALARELATAQRENENQAALLKKAGNETGQLKQVAENATAELRQYQQRERDRTEAMARDHESARRTVGARIKPGPATGNQTSRAAQTAEAAAVVQPAAAEAKGGPEATRLIARASLLLGQGDIGSARIVLERASETGSAKASFMLAETYDPAILTAWGTYGTRGEVTKARELYAKAQAGGISEAKNRLNALPQ